MYLTDEVSYLNCWQAAFPDPQLRLEYEGFPIPVSIEAGVADSSVQHGGLCGSVPHMAAGAALPCGSTLRWRFLAAPICGAL